MELVIERSKWLRGDSDESYLLRSEDGKMCCLGFLAKACGFKDEQISDITTPSELVQPDATALTDMEKPLPDLMAWLLTKDKGYTVHSDDGSDLMTVNDVSVRGSKYQRLRDGSPINVKSDADREAFITATMAKHGITVKFVD